MLDVLKSRTVSSGFGLAAAHIVEMILPFVRSIVLAHLLVPTDFGLAIALSVAAATLELGLDFGFDQSAVRTGTGHDDRDVRLDTLHSLQLLRGVIIGGLLAALGPVWAHLMDRPDAGWAFALLGLGSLIQGFGNLGIKELMRTYRFWPEAMTIAAGQFAWTVVTIWTAFLLNDYRCMVFGILTSATFYVLSSHVLSPIRWRLAWARGTIGDALGFGAPLAPNGMALAATLYGDRFLVGSYLGLPALALYSTVFMAAVLPRGVLLRLMQKIALPIFVNAGEHPNIVATLCNRWATLLSVTAFCYGLAFICFGKPAIGFVFGPTYEPDQTLVSLIAIGVCVKFLLSLPTPPALACGRTGFILLGTIGGAAALIPATVLVMIVPTLEAFVAGLVIGEFVALLFIMRRTISAFPFVRGLTWSLGGGAIAVLAGLAALFETGTDWFVIERMIGSLIGGALFAGVVFLANHIWDLELGKLRMLFR